MVMMKIERKKGEGEESKKRRINDRMMVKKVMMKEVKYHEDGNRDETRGKIAMSKPYT